MREPILDEGHSPCELTRSDRRFHDGRRSYPIPVWNGIFDHCREIGASVWVFLWCLDRITREESGVGIVLGGAEIPAARIARELQDSDRTVRRHLQRLAQHEYIGLKRTPHGFLITVANSLKFKIWRADKTDHPVRTKSRFRSDTSAGQAANLVRCIKEDAAVDSAKRQDLPLNPRWGLTSRDRRKFFDEMDRLCGASLGTSVDEELLIARACVRTGTPVEVAKEWVAASQGLEK